MDMEKTPGSMFEEHQKTLSSAIERGADIKCYKHPKGLRTKTFMIVVVIPIALIMCLFLASLYFFRIDRRHKIVRYRVDCAVEIYVENNETISYIMYSDDLDSGMIFIAPQILKNMKEDFPRGYDFRQEIEINVMDSSRIHTVAINISNVRTDFTTRFMHNFKKNLTAIVDYDHNRCFIMKINHNVTMNAYKLWISIQRMEYLYPKVHETQFQSQKRVVLPAVADLSFADEGMVKDCHDKNVYILTDIRSDDKFPVNEFITKDARFYEFFGRGITEYSLVNLDEMLLYEKHL
ncbi:uncharacterized protein LOC119688357 [Teleopsis dalmanni]|uniref:uncharacterized protein LOC119688357 n=1 Tax=Teleopsis dalmanni TaxID=139649 RepID=UPI0018CE4094|nr:uncharacterized protein LOC119688357 [Teleopsis dalmanni]